MWDKIHSASKEVYGLVKPVRIHSHIKALDVAPSNLPIVMWLVLVAKRDVSDVVLAHKLLERFDDDGLGLTLREISRHEGCTNLQFRGVIHPFVFGGANLESFVMVGKAIVEDVLSDFLSGQHDECEIFGAVRLCKRMNFNFTAIVVRIPHNAPEDVGGGVISKDLAFEV
jgi:hypothetical protein